MNYILDSTEPAKPKGNISQYFASTTKKQKEHFDDKVAKYFYSSNTAFRQADNIYFREMICSLHPGYHAPTAKDIANKLLIKASDEV